MGQKDFEDDPRFEEEWMDRFVELQLKELHGEALSDEERGFLAKVELLSKAFPGMIEELLLGHALEGEKKESIETGQPAYRIAAASRPYGEILYDSLRAAIERNESVLSIDVEGKRIEIFKIYASNGTVEPRYQEGYTFVVERRGREPQVVGTLGGLFIMVEDLKRMLLEYDPASKRIRLYEK